VSEGKNCPAEVPMILKIELDREEDGRWMAEVIDINIRTG